MVYGWTSRKRTGATTTFNMMFMPMFQLADLCIRFMWQLWRWMIYRALKMNDPCWSSTKSNFSTAWCIFMRFLPCFCPPKFSLPSIWTTERKVRWTLDQPLVRVRVRPRNIHHHHEGQERILGKRNRSAGPVGRQRINSGRKRSTMAGHILVAMWTTIVQSWQIHQTVAHYGFLQLYYLHEST